VRKYFVAQEFEKPLSWRKSSTWARKPCSHKVHVSNCLLLSCFIYFGLSIISIPYVQLSDSNCDKYFVQSFTE